VTVPEKERHKIYFFQKKKKRDFLKIAERNKETERETAAEIQRRSSN
jgi:Ser/Thr protein kinase RdoA (MazF antagonist)